MWEPAQWEATTFRVQVAAVAAAGSVLSFCRDSSQRSGFSTRQTALNTLKENSCHLGAVDAAVLSTADGTVCHLL